MINFSTRWGPAFIFTSQPLYNRLTLKLVCVTLLTAITEVVAAARRFVLHKEALTFWRVKTRVVFTVIMKTTSEFNHSHFRGTFHVCLFSNASFLLP
jgi:hypothetical protein